MSVLLLYETKIMTNLAKVYVLTEVQNNEHLPEYPRGTQGSVIGVYSTYLASSAARQKAIESIMDSWGPSDPDDTAYTPVIDSEDPSETIITCLGGDVIFLLKISEEEIL